MEYISALIPIIALFVGAFLARGGEALKSRQDKRSAAYAEFIRAQATVGRTDVQHILEKIFSSGDVSAEEWAVFMQVQEQFNVAHSHVLIYGTPEVVRALSKFYDYGDGTATDEGLKSYLSLIKAMRRDSAARDYAEFEHDVDNIMVNGPAQRRRALFAKNTHQLSEES